MHRHVALSLAAVGHKVGPACLELAHVSSLTALRRSLTRRCLSIRKRNLSPHEEAEYILVKVLKHLAEEVEAFELVDEERATFVADFWDIASYLFVAPKTFVEKDAAKFWKEENYTLALKVADFILGFEGEFTKENLEGPLEEYIRSNEWPMGKVMTMFTEPSGLNPELANRSPVPHLIKQLRRCLIQFLCDIRR